MSLGRHKKQWEPIAISLLIGSIVIAFVVTVIHVLRMPDRSPSRKTESKAASTSSVVRSSGYYRQYGRSLALHELGSEWRGQAIPAKQADDYNVANPEVPRSATPVAALSPDALAVPVIPSPRALKEKQEKQEQSSGWGWLADDIETTRRERSDTGKDDDNEEEENAEEDARLEEERTAGREPDEKEKKEESYFMNAAFEREAKEESKYGVYRDVPMFNPFDRERDEEAAASDIDRIERENSRMREDVSMRNPFNEPMPADIQTSRGDAPLYSIESPFQGEGMGVRLPAGIPDAESSVISYSGNIREPATQNDSMFGAAGVFAAPDPSSSRSESMFSTDSLFGGDQMFSRDAGAAMSGSDVLSAPAGRAGSGIDVRQDPNFKPPSALAW